MTTDFSSLLNEAQLEAVTTDAQHVRVIAGAGSGKTRVLTYRIAYLINNMHVDPSAILAMTFTNKAAKEMKERVAKLLDPDAYGTSRLFLHVSTFHSFCAQFLRKEARAIGYPASFTIFDDEDTEKLIKTIADERGLKKSDPIVKTALHYIGSKKTAGKYPEDIQITRESFEHEKECLSIFMEYEDRKTRMLALDFDDLMLKTLQILLDFDAIRAKWANQYSHILIDEYQDTNDVQFRLMTLLCTPMTSVYVVGDPDQTIYTWRGANQKIILDFPTIYPDAKDVVLNRNYRSTQNILNTANSLIAYNKARVKKDLYTESEAGEKVEGKRFDDAASEAKWVAEKIVSIAGANWPPEFRNIAVLYRSSYMTRSLETELTFRRVPYRIYGGLRFYQRKEVKDVLAYFRLLLNPLDDVAFERIANVPKRSVGDSTVEKLRNEAKANGLSIYNYLMEIEKHPETEVPSRAITALMLLTTKMESVKIKLNEKLEVYSSILRDFITDIGYFEYIKEDEGIDEDRAENVNSLFDDIDHFISENPDSSFDEYLQNISILSSQDDMNDGNYVTLMTIHVAKGLEFDNVFIISMNDGAFPNARALADNGTKAMEEERRLAYVAMTRAKKKLICTCNSGYSYVSDSHAVPSQFFKEAGIQIPLDDYGRRSYGGDSYRGGGRSYGDKSKWRSVGYQKPQPQPKQDYFGDGDAISPFEKKPEPKKEEKPLDNGITDWKVGDRLNHKKFGDGTVIEIVSDKIFIVNFDTQGKKTLLSSHPMITRLHSKGGIA